MHPASPMFLFDTINIGNLYQNNHVFDCETFFSWDRMHLVYSFLVTANEIYLLSEKIVLNSIFEHT